MDDEQKDANKAPFIGMDPAVLRTDSFRFFWLMGNNWAQINFLWDEAWDESVA
jgi:hypothetical protein|nr:hypothetical protein [uncultured Sphaerochaeta sp.]